MRRSELQIATVNAFYIFALFFPGIKAWKHFTALSSAGLMAWRTEKRRMQSEHIVRNMSVPTAKANEKAGTLSRKGNISSCKHRETK